MLSSALVDGGAHLEQPPNTLAAIPALIYPLHHKYKYTIRKYKNTQFANNTKYTNAHICISLQIHRYVSTGNVSL